MIDAHRAAFEYEWRARFHLPLTVVGTRRMSWGEAIRLGSLLRLDPSSQIAAALEGWEYPVPREAVILADLYDLQHASKVKKRPKPYPRPWRQAGDARRFGRTGGRTREQVRAILNRHGHNL